MAISISEHKAWELRWELRRAEKQSFYDSLKPEDKNPLYTLKYEEPLTAVSEI